VPPHYGHGGDRFHSKGTRHMPRYAGPPLAVAVLLMSLSLWLRPTAAPAIDVGDQAPDFVMHSTVGETVQLSAYRGKKNVLLFFFPAAFTSV
jgi:AhpC/TSA family